MWGKELFCKRNGFGIQEWPDGCKYEGVFLNNLKHGIGVFTWTNGEDYRHGKGTYSWPDGSKYTGKFYLNRKEGYGVLVFPDGSIFEGLYHADERFGPGVMTYPDGRQDVGLWHRDRLLRMCSTLEDGFSLEDFPDHMTRLPQKDLKHPQLPVEPEDGGLVPDQGLSEDEEHFILPLDIESYSTDSDHLPVPRRLRRELDLEFFGTSDIRTGSLSKAIPLHQRMNAHIQRHSFETEMLDWDVAEILRMNRTGFGPKGSLELNSEKLIQEASYGECKNVYRLLKDGKIHPGVSDARGHTALIAATTHCHDDVINMLLDCGADVNQLNDEGLSALSVCTVLYYPPQSLQETLTEKQAQNISQEPQIKEDIAHESSPDPMTERDKDDSGSETFETPRLTNQDDRNLEPEKLKAQDQPEVINENTEILQPEDDQNRPSDVAMSRLIQVFDGSIPVGSVSWRDGGKDADEDLEKSVRSDNTAFDSACSMVSFQINVTEEDLQKSAEILCRTGAVSPTDTRETVRKIALLKTEHRSRWNTIELLLERGADPNASTVPMPVLFLAIKAAHVEGVRRLLECGARTDVPLLPQLKGLYPLHIAAGLSGAAGPEITELLLHALADPDAKAQDAQEVYELDQKALGANEELVISGAERKFSDVQFPVEGGRTALHVACQRDDDYTNARDVVAFLLSHNANPNEVWSGHSPLSLAIASGNDLAVDELLSGGADPNLPLGGHVISALCALVNIRYNDGPQPRNRFKLLEKLMKAGAEILQPVAVFDGHRCTMGTVVDYAHFTFQQNKSMAQAACHALSRRERQAHSARRKLLSIMGDLMRRAGGRREQDEFETNHIAKKVFMKPQFKFCHHCGRSVGVQLTTCPRCRQVYYCSEICKATAWDGHHRNECLQPPVTSGKSRRGKCKSIGFSSTPSAKDTEVTSGKSSRGKCKSASLRSPPSAKDKGKTVHLNVTPKIHKYSPNGNYSFI